MKYQNRAVLFLLLLGTIIASCKQDKKTTQTSTSEAEIITELPEDFTVFLDKFLSDSIFQIEHISFPLEGLPADADSMTIVNGYTFKRDEWRAHKPLDEEDDYFQQSFRVISKDLVFEYIQSSDKAFFLERRYIRHTDGWKLVYFQDLQMMN